MLTHSPAFSSTNSRNVVFLCCKNLTVEDFFSTLILRTTAETGFSSDYLVLDLHVSPGLNEQFDALCESMPGHLMECCVSKLKHTERCSQNKET